MPEHGSIKSVPIQEADTIQAEEIEDEQEKAVFLEQELYQLLNMVGNLEAKKVVRIAQLTGMKDSTIRAIEKENITGDEWKQIMKAHVGKPDWETIGGRQLLMSARDNNRYKGILSRLMGKSDDEHSSGGNNQQPTLDDVQEAADITPQRWKGYLEAIESWMERTEQGSAELFMQHIIGGRCAAAVGH